MAQGFTRARATKILTDNIKETTTFIALSTTTPDENGGNFTEPPTSAGYTRRAFGPVNTSIQGQVANRDIIFVFEATEDCGSVTHVGLCDSSTRGSTPFLVGKLTNPITVGAGYVPLIRANKLVIGLDKEALEAYV